MSYSIVIVGIGEWEKYTRPLLDSIEHHNPGCKVVVVDNGSDNFYPNDKRAQVVRTSRVCYAAAINLGVGSLGPIYDWYLIMNNDVLCLGEIEPFLETLSIDTLYGPFFHHKNGRKWIDGWIYALPHRIKRKVGRFDENFQYAAFEDADYCFRAEAQGFKVGAAEFPFLHLERRIRTTLPEFDLKRRQNYQYLVSKHGL